MTTPKLAEGAVTTEKLADGAVTEAKLAAAVIAKLAGGGGSGTGRRILGLASTANRGTIANTFSSAEVNDLVIAYTDDRVAIFEYDGPVVGWTELVFWSRTGGSGSGRTPLQELNYISSQLLIFLQRVLAPWVFTGSGEGIPGSRTYDGLFKSESETGIAAANVSIDFDIGSNANPNEVVDTEAAATSFVITEQQANQAGAYLRVRYNLTRRLALGPLPRDLELILQDANTGRNITKHNVKDEGEGTAQFAFGGIGRKRWALRCVTTGRYSGSLAISEATYHSGKSLADAAIEHVVHPIVSDEAEKRQQQDEVLRDDIARVEGIKAIVNGLPAADATVKKNVVFRSDIVYQQADSDAFQVPNTGFVAFIVGNLGTTAIMPVAYCRNRKEIVYSNADVEVGLQFSGTGKAAVYARKGSALWESHAEAYSTTNGFVMLHWNTAREGGQAESELADLETRVEKLETTGVNTDASGLNPRNLDTNTVAGTGMKRGDIGAINVGDEDERWFIAYKTFSAGATQQPGSGPPSSRNARTAWQNFFLEIPRQPLGVTSTPSDSAYAVELDLVNQSYNSGATKWYNTGYVLVPGKSFEVQFGRVQSTGGNEEIAWYKYDASDILDAVPSSQRDNVGSVASGDSVLAKFGHDLVVSVGGASVKVLFQPRQGSTPHLLVACNTIGRNYFRGFKIREL